MKINIKIFHRWPVHVTIFKERQNGILKVQDKGRRVLDKDNIEKYKLKKAGVFIQAQDFGSIFIDDKGRQSLYLYTPNDRDFFPLKITKSDLTTTDIDTQNWADVSSRESDLIWTKKSFLEKFYPVIMIATIGIVMAIIFYVVLTNIQNLGIGISGAMPELTKACDRLADASEILAKALGQKITEPMPIPAH